MEKYESEHYCNIQLLLKPCQSGKTKECFNMIYKSWISNKNLDINFIICDNSLFQTIQTHSRLNQLPILQQIKSEIMSSQNKKYKEICFDILYDNLRIVVCCNNSVQLKSIDKIIEALEIHKFKIHIYFDEADKYISCIHGPIQKWKNQAQTITFVTATPQDIIKYYDSIPIIPLEESYDRHSYQSLKEQQFIIYDSQEQSAIKFAQSVLETQKLQSGQVWFVPGSIQTKSHDQIAELLLMYDIQVIKLNGNEKMLYLRENDQVKFKDNIELGIQLDEFYEQFNLKNKVVAITGNLCIGRGITINSNKFIITHAIIPNVKNESNIYQLAGRLCGNIKQFTNFNKINIFCSQNTKQTILNLEDKAILLPQIANQFSKEIKLSHYSDQNKEELDAIGETVYFKDFELAKQFVKSLKNSAKINQPKQFKVSLTGRKKKYTIAQYENETQNMNCASLLNLSDIKMNKFSYKLFTLFKDEQHNQAEIVYAVRWSSTQWQCDQEYDRKIIVANKSYKNQIKYINSQIVVEIVD